LKTDLTSNDNLEFKAFSLKKFKSFYESLIKFSEEIKNKNFDNKMKEDLIYNKYILRNKLLNFHPLIEKIKEAYKEIPCNHLKIKMRDNTNFKLNCTNSAVNTQSLINQINSRAGFATLNELLNSLRNTNNVFQNNNSDNNNMDIDPEDLIEDDFYEDEEEKENDEQMEDEYESAEENSEEEHSHEHSH
jgi:hypothetical protein